jgi:oxygen-independent coproporphyrinogen-3 oxidase
MAEVDLIGGWTGRREVSHIHFGGGSPSILTPHDFELLTAHVAKIYDLSKIDEYAIEIDPRTLSEEMVKSYVKSGVNRVSLGIQDYDPKVQEVINRVQSLELIKDNLRWLRDHDLTNINFDLIYGLPYQTVDSIRDNVLQTIELQPSRVALFGYAHVPWMKSHMTMLDEHPMAAPAERGEMFEAASETFLSNGYEAVGLDHFALPGDTLLEAKKTRTLKRNFQGYSVDRADTMIGFGASSISKLDGGYVQNVPSLHSYPIKIKAEKSPVVRGVAITADDRMFYDIISNLMCYNETNPWAVAALHGSSYDFTKEEKMLDQLAAAGYMSRAGNLFKIEAAGRHYLRAIATIFDQYFPQDESDILSRCVHESEG